MPTKLEKSLKIIIVLKTQMKREIIEKCDSVFPNGIMQRKNYNEILDKIDKYAIFIAANVHDEFVGYVAVYANDKKTKIAFISMIGVLESMQYMHIGSLLMDRCLMEAKNRGMEQIRLEVLKTNKKAMAFYEKHGFKFEKICSEKSVFLIRKI